MPAHGSPLASNGLLSLFALYRHTIKPLLKSLNHHFVPNSRRNSSSIHRYTHTPLGVVNVDTRSRIPPPPRPIRNEFSDRQWFALGRGIQGIGIEIRDDRRGQCRHCVTHEALSHIIKANQESDTRCGVTRLRQLQVANKGAIRHIAETTSTARGHSLRPSTINLHPSIPSSQRHAAVAVNACSQPFGGVNTQPAPECAEYVRHRTYLHFNDHPPRMPSAVAVNAFTQP